MNNEEKIAKKYLEKLKMHTEQFLNNFKNAVNLEGQQKIFDFFIILSRFESALKRTENYSFINNNKVFPNWNKLTSDIKTIFDKNKYEELRDAVDYILEHPPKIQSINNGVLVWIERQLDEDLPQTVQLSLYIRTIRNNLFHGGKFVGVYEPDVSRNYLLINSSLIILNEWLDLHEALRSKFLEDI